MEWPLPEKRRPIVVAPLDEEETAAVARAARACSASGRRRRAGRARASAGSRGDGDGDGDGDGGPFGGFWSRGENVAPRAFDPDEVFVKRYSKAHDGQPLKTLVPKRLLDPEDMEATTLLGGTAAIEYDERCVTARYCVTCHIWYDTRLITHTTRLVRRERARRPVPRPVSVFASGHLRVASDDRLDRLTDEPPLSTRRRRRFIVSSVRSPRVARRRVLYTGSRTTPSPW
jgi:hypothetical protein